MRFTTGFGGSIGVPTGGIVASVVAAGAESDGGSARSGTGVLSDCGAADSAAGGTSDGASPDLTGLAGATGSGVLTAAGTGIGSGASTGLADTAGFCMSAMLLLFSSTSACMSLICFSSWPTRALASLTALPFAATSSSRLRTRSSDLASLAGSPFESFRTSFGASVSEGTLSSTLLVILPAADCAPESSATGVAAAKAESFSR